MTDHSSNSHTSSSSSAVSALEDSDLRFAFEEGTVSSVCAGRDEDEWALNVKRAVLSAFQAGWAADMMTMEEEGQEGEESKKTFEEVSVKVPASCLSMKKPFF